MPTDELFADQLAQWGPEWASNRGSNSHRVTRLSLAESRRYCLTLAVSHYENFTVASRLLPKKLRPHFAAVYAYCRWSDDLADEIDDPEQSLALLDWWATELDRAYRSQSDHPVMIALAETIREFDIPREPFLDLLDAFRQDQTTVRYATFEPLSDYCRRSANPVGRLVLYLGRCADPQRLELSDAVCTGLQLANFWQDVAEDWDRGRIYLPEEDRQRFGYTEADFSRRECNEPFRQLMAFEVDRAEEYLRRGEPLIDLLPRELRLPVALFVHGGLAVLDEIRCARFDVWTGRPKVSKWRKLKLVGQWWWKLKN